LRRWDRDQGGRTGGCGGGEGLAGNNDEKTIEIKIKIHTIGPNDAFWRRLGH